MSQSSALAKKGGPLFRRRLAEHRGGELDRQWLAIEESADVAHGSRVCLGQHEVASLLAGSCDEQLDCTVAHGVRGIDGLTRERQPCEPQNVLAINLKR